MVVRVELVEGSLFSTMRKALSAIKRGDLPKIAGIQKPTPTRMPIEAVIQIEAAVVSPRTVRPSLKITPAPRKPMPVMMP